jgi:hypothetical protein
LITFVARVPDRWLCYGYGVVLHEHRYDEVPLCIFGLRGGRRGGWWDGGVEWKGEEWRGLRGKLRIERRGKKERYTEIMRKEQEKIINKDS